MVHVKRCWKNLIFFGGWLFVKLSTFLVFFFKNLLDLLKGDLKVVFLFVCVDLMFPNE